MFCKCFQERIVISLWLIKKKRRRRRMGPQSVSCLILKDFFFFPLSIFSFNLKEKKPQKLSGVDMFCPNEGSTGMTTTRHVPNIKGLYKPLLSSCICRIKKPTVAWAERVILQRLSRIDFLPEKNRVRCLLHECTTACC